jgi:hypothetical protein
MYLSYNNIPISCSSTEESMIILEQYRSNTATNTSTRSSPLFST